VAKIKNKKPVVKEAVGKKTFNELFPTLIRIVADGSVPPKLQIMATLVPFDHSNQEMYGEPVASIKVDDVDAFGAVYPRVARFKEEMTVMIDLVLQLQTKSAELAAADEADKPAIQAELDAIVASFA
jgi:hypothetical protein